MESLILILRQKEQESIAEVENQTKKAQEHLRKHVDEFQDQLDKREQSQKQSVSQIRSLVQRSTGADLVRTNATINELFQGLQKVKLEDMGSIVEWKSPITVFWENQEMFQILQESRIGHFDESATEASQCSVEGFQEATAGLETEIEVNTRNSEGEQCYCPGDVIAVGIISSPGTNVAAETRIVDNNNGRYVISFVPSQARQHTLTLQVNGESIKEFLPICIEERSFTPVSFTEGCFDNSNLKQPWGVAVNDSNEILVTDKRNNRVVVLNYSGEFIRSFGQNLVNLPTGICINKEGMIFFSKQR